MCNFLADPKDLTDRELKATHAEILRQLKETWISLGAATPHSSQAKWKEKSIHELHQWRDEVEEEMDVRWGEFSTDEADIGGFADWVYEMEKDRQMEQFSD